MLEYYHASNITTMKIPKSGKVVVWWRTRDPRATCHRVIVTKREHFLKSSCFSRS